MTKRLCNCLLVFSPWCSEELRCFQLLLFKQLYVSTVDLDDDDEDLCCIYCCLFVFLHISCVIISLIITHRNEWLLIALVFPVMCIKHDYLNRSVLYLCFLASSESGKISRISEQDVRRVLFNSSVFCGFFLCLEDLWLLKVLMFRI